jgi:hypothetical protein
VQLHRTATRRRTRLRAINWLIRSITGRESLISCKRIIDVNYRSARPASFAFALALLCFLPAVGVANAQQCMANYYREKSPACVDEILAQPSIPESDPSTMIGFLAQIFRDSAQERDRILKAESSVHVKYVMFLSLYRAGLPEEAEAFATANNISLLPERVRMMVGLVPLEAVKPSSLPGGNDMFIGAYMASGDTTFIQRILENYSGADDAMAADAFRMGLMTSKFGPDLVPKGRNAVTIDAACAKYRCEQDRAKLLRVLTLAFDLWSLQSLFEQDDGVKKTLSDFLARDARLKNLFTIEQTALENYVAVIALITALADDHREGDRAQAYEAMNKSASIYENLGSAQDAFAPMMNLKK